MRALLVPLVAIAVSACVAGQPDMPAEGPPAPLPEFKSLAPAPGMLWHPGSWHWADRGWEWIPGRWESPPSSPVRP